MAAAAGVAVTRGLWQRLKDVALTDVSVLIKGVDRETLQAIERVLVEADFGTEALDLVEELEREWRRGRLRSEDAVRDWLRQRIVAALPLDGAPLALGDGAGPAVYLILGVNGAGKTTFIAKLAHRLRREGKTVLLAAADTFRAGANEQLRAWASRLGVECVTGSSKGDPAAVAFDAVEAAAARGVNVALIDTAGRLHTHGDLMEELRKIARVVARRRAGAPHETFLVLDGTVGQNAVRQGQAFADAVPLTGLVITKLDGTARGGAVLHAQRALGVPIRFVGVGEGLDDLEAFDPGRFAERLLSG